MRQEVLTYILVLIINYCSCVPLGDSSEFQDIDAVVKEDIGVSLHNIDEVLKQLGISMEKPKKVWDIPKKIRIHPTSCELLNYCKGEFAPPVGTFYRHPIYPWWYYSCDGTKVKCHSCHKNKKQDTLTLFYSERCQKCITKYEDSIHCFKKKKDSRLNI